MLDYQDEIASSYRRTCADLKEKLKLGLEKIYNTYKDGCQGNSSNPENCVDNIFDSLVVFERELLQYIRIKQEFQTENKNLQMKLKELQLNLQAKNVCISKFKEDVVSHYIQVEFLRKHNEKLEGDLGNTRKKLNQFERSEEWLKKHLFSLNENTKLKQELIPDEVYQQRNKIKSTQKNEEMQEGYNYKSGEDKSTNGRYENVDELRKFHVKLMEVFHENIFLKQALQKMRNITDSEDKLRKLLKLNHENSSSIKHEEITKESQSKFDIIKENEKDKSEQITQLNSIIDGMKATVLQLQFEKRDMELSIFKIREYFLRLKDIHRKLKLMLVNRNQSFTSAVLEKSRKYDVIAPTNEENNIQVLTTIIDSLRKEKLQMEMEHHEELCCFNDRFGDMQYILRDIKTVCDDISKENELYEQKSRRNGNRVKKQIFKENFESASNLQNVEINPDNVSANKITFGENLKCEKKSTTSSSMTTRSLNSHDNNIPNYKTIPQDVHRRMNLIEEKYKRIVSVCSKNMELLKELDDRSLIEELKVLALTNEKELVEKRNRFQKFKRFLLNSLKDYKKSFKVKEKQYETLRNLCIPIALELKNLKNHYTQNEIGMLNSEDKNDFTEIMRRIDILTERIELHIGSSGLVHHSDTSEIPNYSCENIITTSREDLIEKHLEKQALANINCTGKRKKRFVCSSPEHPMKSEATLNESCESSISFREDINISNSLIEQLKKDKSILETALTQRDHLFGKIFNSFRQKIEDVAEEMREKYFLQRLCNDLKSAIKVYSDQNKILREALENNNICTKTIYIQRTLRRNSANDIEDYIRGLLEQQKDSSQIQETFNDIHFHLQSMKNDLSLLQDIAIKR